MFLKRFKLDYFIRESIVKKWDRAGLLTCNFISSSFPSETGQWMIGEIFLRYLQLRDSS